MYESCHMYEWEWVMSHEWMKMRCGVATISRIDKIVGRFRRIASLLWGFFAKETYDLIDATKIR